MYLHRTPTYYRGTTAVKPRAPFLLLMSRTSDTDMRPQLYAVVRTVAMRQLGHWMMGNANVGGAWMTISGAYGNDGLPMTVDDDEIPWDAVALPDELAHAFWTGGGWNSAGSEAPLLRDWALDHLPKILAQRE